MRFLPLHVPFSSKVTVFSLSWFWGCSLAGKFIEQALIIGKFHRKDQHCFDSLSNEEFAVKREMVCFS